LIRKVYEADPLEWRVMAPIAALAEAPDPSRAPPNHGLQDDAPRAARA
jgi:hypothetical protein